MVVGTGGRSVSRSRGRRYAEVVSRREEILDQHGAAIRAAARRHKASSISLVGSVARGTDDPGSDCDFVCEFAPGADLFDLVRLRRELVQLLGCNVDVCSQRALSGRYRSMLEDAIAV